MRFYRGIKHISSFASVDELLTQRALRLALTCAMTYNDEIVRFFALPRTTIGLDCFGEILSNRILDSTNRIHRIKLDSMLFSKN